jgi:hypothetical protein
VVWLLLRTSHINQTTETKKKAVKLMSVLTLSAFLGIANPVMAQSNDNATGTTAIMDDDDDDTGKWDFAKEMITGTAILQTPTVNLFGI